MSFSFVIIPLSLGLRQLLFEQNLDREFEVIQSLTQLLYSEYSEDYLDSFEEEDADFLALEVALNTSNYKGVLGIGVYDKDFNLREQFPLRIYKQEIPLPQQLSSDNIKEYIKNDNLPFPLLKLLVPIASGSEKRVHHHILYWINASDFENKIRKIDSIILYYTLAAWFIACFLLLLSNLIFELISRNIRSSLQEKELDLKLINNEVNQHLKSSALGAISASLIHDIKNPLNSLDAFIKSQQLNINNIEEDWELAQKTTQKMREMVTEVSNILRDNPQLESLHYDWADIQGILEKEFAGKSEILNIKAHSSLSIPSRYAAQLIIILKQLIRNSIEVSNDNNLISVEAEILANSEIIIRVKDCAGGLSEEIKSNLFKPLQSTKAQGSGLGLYIAGQLAKTIGAKLSLEKSDPEGSVFLIQFSYIKP